MDIYVRQGDSLWYFSQLYGINLQLIVDSNRDIQPNQLAAGQRIRIPGFVAQSYQIRRGDSFGGLPKGVIFHLMHCCLLTLM